FLGAGVGGGQVVEEMARAVVVRRVPEVGVDAENAMRAYAGQPCPQWTGKDCGVSMRNSLVPCTRTRDTGRCCRFPSAALVFATCCWYAVRTPFEIAFQAG